MYMASPICLSEYGEGELIKMHLAVNADKYLKGEDLAAQCMKTGKAYKVSTLLNWEPLQSRGYRDIHHQIKVIDKDDLLVEDGKGNMIPPNPGRVIPITMLPDDHVAIQYLRGRNFDTDVLYKQFRVGYCESENKEVYYRKLLDGFRATPQGRIIFYSDVYGVHLGWQARIIDIKQLGTDGVDYHFYYHPYRKQWQAVEHKVDGNWEKLPGFDGWDDAKYIIATGAKRNQMLLGFDAALEYNERSHQKWIGLTEGPLDAGRLGPPFCAVMGKSFGIRQAELCKVFGHVVFAVQNDEYSARLEKAIINRMGGHGIPVTVIRPDPEFNDFGEMSTERSKEILATIIK